MGKHGCLTGLTQKPSAGLRGAGEPPGFTVLERSKEGRRWAGRALTIPASLHESTDTIISTKKFSAFPPQTSLELTFTF